MKKPPTSNTKKVVKVPLVYAGITDPDQLFYLICVRNWFNGNLNGKMPVDENRAAFLALKELLPHSTKK